MFLGIIKLKLNKNILNLGCRHRIEDCQEGTLSTAKVDGAFHFDGDDDHIHIENSSTLFMTAPFSISLWFKADTLASAVDCQEV